MGSRGWVAIAGYVVIFGTCGVLLVTHTAHAVLTDESLQSFLLGIFSPLVLTLSLLASATWLVVSDIDTDHVPRIAGWTLAGTGLLVGGVVLAILYQEAHGVMMDDRAFVVLGAASFGAPTGFVVGLYDARRRTALSEMATAQEATERANHRLTVINRVLRHDIRNGANVVRARARLIAEQTNGQVTEHTEMIRRRANAFADIGDRARDLERMLHSEWGGRTRVDLAAAVRQRVDLASDEFDQATFETDLPESATVAASPLLESAVDELLHNAVEHNDGPATVDVSVENRGDTVWLCIADDGPGVPDSEAAVIERGYETDLEHTSGLGLWFVAWVVDESDGEVTIESTAAGSRVEIELAAITESTTQAPA